MLKQISIKLENTPGIIYEITEALAEENINLHALTISESAGHGIIRLLCSDVKKARQILMNKHIVATIEEVISVNVPDTPGGLTVVLKPLFEQHVNIDYMYAFSKEDGQAVTVFQFSDNEKAMKILKKNNLK